MARKKSRLMTANQVKSWLQPKVSAFGKRHRIAARIRMANSWATRHPKRTFSYVLGSLLMVLFCDIAIAGIKAENQMDNVSQIANVEPVFNGFRTIQANKDNQRKALLEMTAKGQSLHQELDSLIAIPHKSHRDSIEIIRRYNRLENIVNSLKQNDNVE